MAKFEVKIYKLTIEDHPNADVIELARIGDYLSIVSKGQFKTGDLGVYIPEAAIVPDWLISELGLEGKLAGKKKNRVKAIKLRSILSQGLIVPIIDGVLTRLGTGADEDTLFVEEGDDVTDFLDIVKWEPLIPIHMKGEIYNAFGKTLKSDIENIKKFPDVFEYGEEIYITEKLHGIWCCMGSYPEVDIPIVTSKGLSDKGLAFKLNDANKDNSYVKAFYATIDNNLSIIERAAGALGILLNDTPLYLLGEIFGTGIQDLHYGITRPQFRLFDVYIGEPTRGRYINPDELTIMSNVIGFATVPILYTGRFSKDIIDEYTGGKETISGKETHVREGIVIKPLVERRDIELGRVMLKSVSDGYLLRKNKNATEFA